MLIFSSEGFRAEKVAELFHKIITDTSGRLLIIPLAGMTCRITGEYERRAAEEFGFRLDRITVFTDKHPVSLVGEHFDYVYLPGGNTFKLMADLRRYRLDSVIKQNYADGAVFIGASAGAYVACPDIECAGQFDKNTNFIKDGNFSGLGLTDRYVFPHSDYHGYEAFKIFREKLGMDKEIIRIDNTEVITVEGDIITSYSNERACD